MEKTTKLGPIFPALFTKYFWTIKSRRMRWARYVAVWEARQMRREFLWGRPEE